MFARWRDVPVQDPMEPQRTPAILVLLACARNRVARIERQQSEICARGPLLEKDAAGTGEPGGTVDRAEYSVAMTASPRGAVVGLSATFIPWTLSPATTVERRS